MAGISPGCGHQSKAEAEEAFARGQFLAELGADDARSALTGPAGAEAEARRAELARHTVFDGQVVTDEARLRRILARHDTNLYPGTFVYHPDRCRNCLLLGRSEVDDGARVLKVTCCLR